MGLARGYSNKYVTHNDLINGYGRNNEAYAFLSYPHKLKARSEICIERPLT